MKKWIPAFALVAGVVFMAAPAIVAQYGANKIEVRKQCLSDDDLNIIRTIRSLKRATNLQDPDLPFNPDYFVGTWNFNWINSEVPWSAAGPNDGTVTFKYVENCYYEGQ